MTIFNDIFQSIMGKILGHNRASGKESEHSIIGKIKSIMCIGLFHCIQIRYTHMCMYRHCVHNIQYTVI